MTERKWLILSSTFSSLVILVLVIQRTVAVKTPFPTSPIIIIKEARMS